jgi:hypothetical protein
MGVLLMNEQETMTKEGLKQLDLNDLQIEQTLEIIHRCPEKLDIKRIQRVIDQIKLANQALIKLNEFDPHFVAEADRLLSPEHALADDPLEAIANALQMHLDNQAVNIVQEVELLPESADSKSPSNLIRRATTPTSKNFKRYQLLTKLWESWEKKVNLYESSDFIMFLAIALEGSFTLQKGSKLRKHYSRYYLGVDLEKNEINLGETKPMNIGINIYYKAKDGAEQRVERSNASLEAPLAIDGKKLVSEVNAKRR